MTGLANSEVRKHKSNIQFSNKIRFSYISKISQCSIAKYMRRRGDHSQRHRCSLLITKNIFLHTQSILRHEAMEQKVLHAVNLSQLSRRNLFGRIEIYTLETSAEVFHSTQLYRHKSSLTCSAVVSTFTGTICRIYTTFWDGGMA